MQARRTKKEFRLDSRFCFKLPATLGDRGTMPYERLNVADDLARWLAELGFTDFTHVISEQDLELTKHFREVVQRAGEALAKGQTIKRKDLNEINTTAMLPPPIPQLSKNGQHSIWLATELGAVLSMIARDFIELATGPLSAQVKLCAHPSCQGVFVDESRPKNRRWCSMQTCGNLMKKTKIQQRN